MELIWYISNKQNQMLRSPFCLETGPDCLSGANPNKVLVITVLTLALQTKRRSSRDAWSLDAHPIKF